MKRTTSNKQKTVSIALGQSLRDERIRRGFSVSGAAQELKLRPEDIHRFENGTHTLNTVYERGSLKAYARLLDIPLDKELTHEADRDTEEAQISRRFRPLRSFVASTALAKTWIVSIILLSFLVVGFLVFRLLAPPTLMIDSPADDRFVQASSIEVRGRTTTGSEVFVNGSPVLVDLEGNFSDTFLLREGVNEITVTATNSLSRTAQKEFVIVAEYPQISEQPQETGN